MASATDFDDPNNPIYRIEQDSEIYLIILVYSLGVMSLSLLVTSIRNTVKAWTRTRELTSLSFLQVMLGTYWTKSFPVSKYPELKSSDSNLNWAIRVFVVAFMLFSFYYLIGKEFFDAFFGFG